jgi:hypothetical protein
MMNQHDQDRLEASLKPKKIDGDDCRKCKHAGRVDKGVSVYCNYDLSNIKWESATGPNAWPCVAFVPKITKSVPKANRTPLDVVKKALGAAASLKMVQALEKRVEQLERQMAPFQNALLGAAKDDITPEQIRKGDFVICVEPSFGLLEGAKYRVLDVDSSSCDGPFIKVKDDDMYLAHWRFKKVT